MKRFKYFAFLAILLIVGCSKGKSVPAIPGDHGEERLKETLQVTENFFDSTRKVYPLYPDAPYAQKAAECVYNFGEKSCLVAEVPLLGLYGNVTVESIMKRTLVSHPFLGEAFREVLLRLKPETLEMFGAVSAIVISDLINPSFYLNDSGAIYLSGRYFWRTPEERKLVTQVIDGRSSAVFSLPYLFDSDYVVNGQSIETRESDSHRTYEEIARIVSRLLFHELAHANDYFERSFYRSEDFNEHKTYDELAYERYSTSKLISQRLPVHVKSEILIKAGQIWFQGEKATEEDKKTTVETIIKEFTNDVASDVYAYSTHHEDLAMLTEEALMLTLLNYSRYVAIVQLPHADYKPTPEFAWPISWAVKKRIADPVIKPRAIFAVENVLNKNLAQKVKNKLDLESSITFPAKTDWSELYK